MDPSHFQIIGVSIIFYFYLISINFLCIQGAGGVGGGGQDGGGRLRHHQVLYPPRYCRGWTVEQTGQLILHFFIK